MTKDELKVQLPDTLALLLALGQLMPNRVDEELCQFIDRASNDGCELDLLHSALALVAKKAPVRKLQAV